MKTPTHNILVFTVMFSSTSFAGWTKVVTNVGGNTYYLDLKNTKTRWVCLLLDFTRQSKTRLDFSSQDITKVL